MKITIKTEKIIDGALAKRRILSVKSLDRKYLPAEYVDGDPFVAKHTDGINVYFRREEGDDGNLEWALYEWYDLPKIVSEEEFQVGLIYIRRACERLTEINKRARELAETWKGGETFVI